MKRQNLWGSALALALIASTSAMAGSTPTTTKAAPAPGTQVVDSKGTIIGNYMPYFPNDGFFSLGIQNSGFTRQIGGVWMAVMGYPNPSLFDNGFWTAPLNGVPFEYTTANCTGTKYLAADGLYPMAYATNPSDPTQPAFGAPSTTIYYPATPFIELAYNSYQQGNLSGLAGPPTNGVCVTSSGQIRSGAAASTTLTVVPPLSIQ